MVYMGGNMDPHQAFMVIRGVKTLSLRIDKAQENAMKIAEFLENHPKVEWIKYPGLNHLNNMIGKRTNEWIWQHDQFWIKRRLSRQVKP